MRSMRYPVSLLLAWLLLMPLGAIADASSAADTAPAPRVAVSILPLHSLTSALMAGVGKPELVIPANASPHAYALRPSQARALADATLIVWLGPELETPLIRPLRSLADGARVLALREAEGVTTLPRRTDTNWHGAREHDHDQDAQGIDAHLWLDPRNALPMARAIARALTQVDPANRAAYAHNLQRLEQRLQDLDADLEAQLAPLRAVPYWVFHDGYQYLEARYGLNARGAISLSPERPPGARHLRELRRALGTDGTRCVFSEPQFKPALVETLIEGTPVRHGVLDPLGAGVTPGPRAYFTLMHNLGDGLRACLQAAGAARKNSR